MRSGENNEKREIDEAALVIITKDGGLKETAPDKEAEDFPCVKLSFTQITADTHVRRLIYETRSRFLTDRYGLLIIYKTDFNLLPP